MSKEFIHFPKDRWKRESTTYFSSEIATSLNPLMLFERVICLGDHSTQPIDKVIIDLEELRKKLEKVISAVKECKCQGYNAIAHDHSNVYHGYYAVKYTLLSKEEKELQAQTERASKKKSKLYKAEQLLKQYNNIMKEIDE